MKKFIALYKMGKEIITLGDIEIEKHKLHQHKKTQYQYIIFDRIVVSKKVPFGKNGFKYFIGYENDYGKILPLCIMLPNMGTYRRNFDETKDISFLIKDNELLEK